MTGSDRSVAHFVFAFSPISTGRRLCQLDIDSLGLSIVLARF
jgi:hypothetical protein